MRVRARLRGAVLLETSDAVRRALIRDLGCEEIATLVCALATEAVQDTRAIRSSKYGLLDARLAFGLPTARPRRRVRHQPAQPLLLQ
jgi:hypothetical protein